MRTSSSGRARPLVTPRTSTPPLKPIALAVALAIAAPHAALAAPVGHTVVAGDVTVTQPNAQTMMIHQGSDKAILNWRGFSIAAGEKVQFVQPGSRSVALNRVTGGAPSEILGRLEANGKVFLVNPSGVMFGRGASVDVGGLVASTLGIGDDDFLAGRYTFDDGGGAGAVSNEGRLAAAERGTIALLGTKVSNAGTVTARLGTVGLAAGGKVTLDFNGDGLTRIVVDAARINALVENGGAIISEGGQVTMTARALGAIADTVVRHQGVVQATGLVERNGRILLDGGTEGRVELAGKLDAGGIAPGLRGGDVTLLGRDIYLAAGAQIDASGDAGGGKVLVGGDYQGANPLVPHAASTTMTAGATIRADALGAGDGGRIVLWSDGHTSARGSASATGGAHGGNGGIVETSGRTLDVAGMRVKAGAARGVAGTWLLDPGDIVVDDEMAESIADSLNSATNVTVSTQDADSDGPGDIYVVASIEKTGGGDATLRLDADNDIRLDDDVRIASLGAAGKLNVDFNADADISGSGGVMLLPGSAVLSNGGDVRIYGQGDPVEGRARGSDSLYEGVLLEGALIDSRRGQSDAGASGLIAIAGSGDTSANPSGSRGESLGVRINDSSLLSTTGDITIRGVGASAGSAFDGRGVAISLAGGARIATTTGALDITGTAGNTGSDGSGVAGLDLLLGVDSSISTAGGTMSFTGTGNDSGSGIDLAASGATIDSGGPLAMTGGGGIRANLNNSTLEAGGLLSFNGTGTPSQHGVALSMLNATLRAPSVEVTGSGGTFGDGIRLSMNNSSIDSSAGGVSFSGSSGAFGYGIKLSMRRGARIDAGVAGVSFTGSGGDFGDGIEIEMDAASIEAAGPVALVGSGGADADGVALNMVDSAIDIAGALAISGTGGGSFDGAVVDLDESTLRAADIAISGEGGWSGAGVSSILTGSTILATNGALAIDGTGGGTRAGIDIFMSGARIGTVRGDTQITGTGGDLGGSGVHITSYDEETGADGSAGSGGIMGSSSARLNADGGSLTVAGINGAGGIPVSDALTAAAVGFAAGVELTGIELRASAGDVRIAGAGVSDGDVAATGVALTNVLAATAAGPGDVRIVGVSSADTPGVTFDGVTLGTTTMSGNIIIGGRNAGTGPVFSYPGASQWTNTVRTAGVINLRPDDGNYDYGGVPASSVPIVVGGGSGPGFRVSFGDLGIGRLGPANVVVGSSEHTGRITYLDASPFAGNLTLQNGGAGSQGIVLAADLDATGLVTLSTGGSAVASESAINSSGLLLHGSQPEASFALDTPGHSVSRFAAHFDGSPGAARPEYGDVSFRNEGQVALTALAGKGFSAAAEQATDIAAPNSVVAGDLLLRSSGALALEQDVSTRGGGITLVTDGVLRSNGHALVPAGGTGWRVFADTWVGEDRTGLTPSQPRPNYYNCAYGGACAAAIGGNRFIYRAQPTLTLTPDNIARVYGAANPALTYTPTGLVNGDSLADALSGAYTTSAQQSSSVGAYTIVGSFTSPVGYAIDARAGTLSIDRAALLISVDDKNKVYGDADPLLTATFAGLAAHDNAAVVTGLTLTAPTGAAASAGSHAIVGANAVATNYAISYRPGTLTVAKAPLVVLPDDQAKVYGDPEPVLTAGFSGLRYADSGAVVSGLTLATATGAAATAGSHPITASGGTAANYTLSYQTGTLRVARAPLLVVADNKSKVYGAPDPVLTATMSGFRYGDTASAVQGLALSAPSGAAAGAGSHPIVVQGGAAANYALSYRAGVLAVDQAVLTYVADPIRQLQGAAQPITGSVTGFVYDDTLASATSGTLQFVALSPALAPPGVYAVEGRGLAAANYRFVQSPSNLTALTTLPVALDERPTIAKDITFESSKVYEKNFGSPRLCVGLGPLGAGSGSGEGNDLLALEWSRVRVSPNLSNCLGLGQRNSCQDF